MKKLLLVIFLFLVICGTLTAKENSKFSFVFADLDQHPEILDGFLPTLLEVGMDYNLFKLSEDEITKIRFTLGGGYTQRQIYQHPLTGKPLDDHILIYDVIQVLWDLRFSQTFINNIMLNLGYKGRWEKPVDSLLLSGGGIPKPSSIARKRGISGETDVVSIDDWFKNEMGDEVSKESTPIYPDFHEESNVFNILYTEFVYNKMKDTGVINDGYLVKLKIETALPFINKNACYLGASLNAVASKTLYEIHSNSNKNLFSIVLIDRVNISYGYGSAFPTFAQSSYSLGRKVRGFNSRSYNTNFSMVNNLDIRFSGPEFPIKQIFPRLNVFLDIGYGTGNYFNTGYNTKEVKGNNFLASSGIQIEMDFFDMFDLGIEFAYLLSGKNVKNPSKNFQVGATFFLDF